MPGTSKVENFVPNVHDIAGRSFVLGMCIAVAACATLPEAPPCEVTQELSLRSEQ